MNTKMTKGQVILASIVTVGFLLLSGIVIIYAWKGQPLPSEIREFWLMVFTAWILNFNTIIQWNFGSSKGSADKTAMMAAKLEDTSGPT